MGKELRVLVFAACCRILLLTLASIFGLLFENYDTSASLNVHGECGSSQVDVRDVPLGKFDDFLENWVVWDSVYFTRVSKCGYEFEQNHAFFPAYPWLIGFVRRVVDMFPINGSAQSSLAVSGLMMSNISYILSVVLFYSVSRRVLKDERLSGIATVFYTFSPASVFLSGIYTESLFAFFTMTTLWYLYVKNSIWGGSAFVALSCATRSNGILHIGFIGHVTLMKSVREWKQSRWKSVITLVKGATACIVGLCPFIAFQFFGYKQFCVPPISSESIDHSNGVGLTYRPWCDSKLPYLYGFVQDHYWDVGFLKYFELKQIPNFLIASPVLLLSFYGCFSYITSDVARTLTLGLTPQSRVAKGFYNDDVAPFVYQWAFLSLVAFLVMYVQVSTRFLSACPPLYWIAAHLWSKRRWTWLWWYFILWALLGALMFPNFYPWT